MNNTTLYQVYSNNTEEEDHQHFATPHLGLHFYTFTKTFFTSLNALDHLLIIGLTLVICFKCFLIGFKKTAMHAHLCTLGFVFFIGEGVMVRSVHNVLSWEYRPPTKNLVHFILQATGGALGIAGSIKKYCSKDTHLRTQHGRFGVLACALCAISSVAGVCALFSPPDRMLMQVLHPILGFVTYLVAMLAQLSGYDTGFFRRNFIKIPIFKIITIIIVILTILGPFNLILLKIASIWKLVRWS